MIASNRLQEHMHGSLTGATKQMIEQLRKRVERTGKAGQMHAISVKTGIRLKKFPNIPSLEYEILMRDNKRIGSVKEHLLL